MRDLYSLLSPNTEANQLSPITKTVDTVSSENATEQSKHVKISQSDSSSSNNSSSSEDSDSEDEMKRIDSEKSSKNVQNGKTLNGRASLTNRSSNNSVDLFQQLLSASNRGREVGGEGLWDTVSSELADVVREKAVKQRRLEQVERKARISSEWDQQLDRGRSKKIKLKDSNKTMSNENLFQKVQNQRLQNN